MVQVYSDQQLLQYIKDLINQLRRTPTRKDMDNADGYPHSDTYRQRFESWNNAIIKANGNPRKNRCEDEELIMNLRKIAYELKRPPRRIDLIKMGVNPSYKTYEAHFGSFQEAVIIAGLRTRSKSHKRFPSLNYSALDYVAMYYPKSVKSAHRLFNYEDLRRLEAMDYIKSVVIFAWYPHGIRRTRDYTATEKGVHTVSAIKILFRVLGSFDEEDLTSGLTAERVIGNLNREEKFVENYIDKLVEFGFFEKRRGEYKPKIKYQRLFFK